MPSVRAFWQQAATHWREEDGEPVSYEAARTYHFDRDPPIGYLNAVTAAFGARLEWLATGRGPRTQSAEDSLAATAQSGSEALDRILAGVGVRWRGRLWVAEMHGMLPSWGPGLLEVWRRYFLILDSVIDYTDRAGESDEERFIRREAEVEDRKAAAAAGVSAALRSCLEAFGLDPAGVDQERFEGFAHAIVPALLQLADLSRIGEALDAAEDAPPATAPAAPPAS